MAQKIKPNAFRLGITKPWSSRWFFKKSMKFFLEEDELIRSIIRRKILAAGIADLTIDRPGEMIKISIKAGRPGLVIGRGGKGIDELKNELVKEIKKLRRKNAKPLNFSMNINVEELKRSEISAAVVSQQIAFDIEKRIPFRIVMRRQMELLKQNRDVKGAKIKISGRLNGSEISRSEWLNFGQMPLQSLRANVDYGEATSYNSYGTVGVKVWIYKGEIFE